MARAALSGFPARQPAPLLDLAFVGLSVAPPGFSGSPVQLPPPRSRRRNPAAAARAAALLRLASAAAARFLQQHLDLTADGPLVRRVWVTPGGRLAAHVALPIPLAAQVMARKRHRLRGTSFSVDLLRDQASLAVQRLELQQLRGDAGPPADGPSMAMQLAGWAGAALSLPRLLSPPSLTLILFSTLLLFSAILLVSSHCSHLMLHLGWRPP